MRSMIRGLVHATALGVIALVVPQSLSGQHTERTMADSLTRVGDIAGRESRHRDAIDAYERAIVLDSTRRVGLLHRLGRQYLWSDQPRHAATLFTELLAKHPEACQAELDLGLAWSWANELAAARATYDDVATRCLYERGQARLGAARALRWDNQFTKAERRYRQVLADGTDADREQAIIGLIYIRLARAEPRRALALADSLVAAGSRDPSLAEARVMALADLGAFGEAMESARDARATGRGSASLDRLTNGYSERARPSFAAGVRGFRDRDGTSYRAADAGSAVAPLAVGTLRAAVRTAELRNDSVSLRSQEVEGSLELRPAAALAIIARGGARRYDFEDFTPWDGELDLVWLPGDRRRVDVAAARILVSDNVAAVQEQLVGTFGSIGITERLTSRFSAALSVDATQWSEGNMRIRVRATPRLALEGVPVMTLEWPTIYQRYDEPFDFQLFSPPEYIETGPAFSVYQRVARVWYLSVYARGGALRETDQDWQPLGIARASVEREISSHWGMRIEAGWSNSNLAGSTGFERATLTAGFSIRP